LHGSSPRPLGSRAAAPVGGRSVRSAGRSQPVNSMRDCQSWTLALVEAGRIELPSRTGSAEASTCVSVVPVFPGSPRRAARQALCHASGLSPAVGSDLNFPSSEHRRAQVSTAR